MNTGQTGPKTPEGKRKVSQNAYKHGAARSGAQRLGIRPCIGKCPKAETCAYFEPGTDCAVEQEAFTAFVQRVTEGWQITDPGAAELVKVAAYQALRLARCNEVLAMLVHDAFKPDREYLLRETRSLESSLTSTLKHARAMNGHRTGGKVSLADFALGDE